jgi:hypothetical protein
VPNNCEQEEAVCRGLYACRTIDDLNVRSQIPLISSTSHTNEIVLVMISMNTLLDKLLHRFFYAITSFISKYFIPLIHIFSEEKKE